MFDKTIYDRKKLSIVKSRLLNSDFLSRYGYSFIKKQVQCSRLAGVSWSFEYLNKTANRSISISYWFGYKNYPEEISIIFYNDNNGILPMDDYLEKINGSPKKEALKRFRLHNYPGTFPEKVDSFFKFLSNSFDNELNGIVTGKEWLDIPFEWRD